MVRILKIPNALRLINFCDHPLLTQIREWTAVLITAWEMVEVVIEL